MFSTSKRSVRSIAAAALRPSRREPMTSGAAVASSTPSTSSISKYSTSSFITNNNIYNNSANTKSDDSSNNKNKNLGNARRSYSSSRLMGSNMLDIEDDLSAWPVAKANTAINVCPQATAMVVERLGKFNQVHYGGLFFAIPIIDDIRFVIDMREKSLSITPQSAITKDNVHVTVSGNLYCQFIDPEKASYGSKNPIYAVKQIAQSAMRAAIGELELDEILHARAQLNKMIQSSVQGAADAWGIDIKRYEITDITPDKFITEAMDKQAAAERERRKKVLDAEGDKRAAELQSEGEKIRMKNESEGNLIKVRNEAEAKKTELILEAEGRAKAEEISALARAKAIEVVALALASENGQEAAKLQISREYITMYGEMGARSNTMIFSDRPGDVNALIAQAAAIIDNKPNKDKHGSRDSNSSSSKL